MYNILCLFQRDGRSKCAAVDWCCSKNISAFSNHEAFKKKPDLEVETVRWISGKWTLLTWHEIMSCSSEDYGETKVIGSWHILSTHFYRIREGGGSGHPPPAPTPIDTLYIILKAILWRFRFNLNLFNHFDFVTLWVIFAKWLPKSSRMDVRKKFKLLNYEHIIYHFKAVIWRFR